jgi:hypothetical protein
LQEDLASYGVDPQLALPFEGRTINEVLGIFQGIQQVYKHDCETDRKTRINFGIIADDIRGVSLFECYDQFQEEEYYDLAADWHAERDF